MADQHASTSEFSSRDVVYIVDDDDAVRCSLLAMLESSGFLCLGFARGSDFLQHISPAARGCLVLDIRLPDMSGLEVQAALTASGYRLPVIAITAYADVALAVEVMKAGALDFLEKPYSEEALLDRVRQALDSQASGPRSGSQPEVAVAARFDRLTAREREVLEQVVAGKQSKQIAYDLQISPRTVEIHRARVMLKMEARNLAHLVRMVLYGNAPLDQQ